MREGDKKDSRVQLHAEQIKMGQMHNTKYNSVEERKFSASVPCTSYGFHTMVVPTLQIIHTEQQAKTIF